MDISSKKNYFLLVIILSIVALLVAVPLLDINLDFRKQAKVGSSDIDLMVDTHAKNSLDGQYNSEESKYFILYNPNIWEEQSVPETVLTADADNSYFVTKDRRNFSAVYISSSELPSKYVDLFADEVTEENLDQFADSLERNFDLKSTNKYSNISYIGKEIIELNGQLVIRFEFSEEFLGKSTNYYEYIIPHTTFYLEVETKFVNKFTGEEFVIDFIKNISFTRDIATVLGESIEYDESKSTALVKPSVISIVHTYCDQIKGANNTQYLKTYQVCSGGKGSGFFVGDNYIATNGHVVANYPEEAVIANLLTFNPQIGDFVVDYIKEAIFKHAGIRLSTLQAQEVGLLVLQNPAGLSSFVEDLYESMETKEFSISRTSDNHYIGFGNKAFEMKEEELTLDNIAEFVALNDNVKKASLVDYDYGNFFAKTVFIDGEKPNGSDVALLLPEDESKLSLPSLSLSTSTVREGDSILVIGFPGLVSGSGESDMLLDYDSSSTQTTISKGIISSIKQDNSGRDLFQTDASIDHGNSGGPAFNQESKIIGLATYGFESAIGNFNFLRDVKDLKQLAENNDINLEKDSSTYEAWKKGLEYFWESRYSKSVNQFKKVKKDYPMHPDVDSYIEEAEVEIKAGNDVDLMFGVQKQYVFSAFGLAVVILSVAALIKKRKASLTKPMAEVGDAEKTVEKKTTKK